MERKHDMHQKYLLSIDREKNELKIREYAVVDKYPKNEIVSSLKKNSFTFLCEETYSNDIIMDSIPKGINTLVAILRTPNIFPIGHNAARIAKEVAALYNSPENGLVVELIFDDLDSVDS